MFIVGEEVDVLGAVGIIDHRCLVCDEVLWPPPMVDTMSQTGRQLNSSLRIIKEMLLFFNQEEKKKHRISEIIKKQTPLFLVI